MRFGERGNLTGDPQVQTTDSGKTVVRWSIAVDRSYRDSSGDWVRDEPIFVPCEMWGPAAAAFANTARKGAPVIVVGDWRARAWEADGGEKRRRQWVAVDHVGFAVVPGRRAAPEKPSATDPDPALDLAPDPGPETARPAADLWDVAQ